MLPEFTHFVFIIIDTHLSLHTKHLPQNTHILSKSTHIYNFIMICLNKYKNYHSQYLFKY